MSGRNASGIIGILAVVAVGSTACGDVNAALARLSEVLVATAITTVREIQVLQAPHIADADDAVMTRMEKEMAASEAAARSVLKKLAPLASPASRRQLATAGDALDGFMALNAEIIVLSRRNTNVRSLALSLDQKRGLAAPCDERLQAIQAALGKRGYPAGR